MPRGSQLTQTFSVPPDALWEALGASLPWVATQATWYDTARRVEWSTDATGTSWGQGFAAVVEPAPTGACLILTGQGRFWWLPSVFDRGARSTAFRTLLAAVGKRLGEPLGPPTLPSVAVDEFRWWDGRIWTPDPPPA